MPIRQDPLYHLATVMQRRFVNRSPEGREIDIASLSWERCLKLTQQLNIAQRRGWQVASCHLYSNLRTSLEHHVREVQTCLRDITSTSSNAGVVSVRNIYDDLRALHDEFTVVEFKLRSQTLSVNTEPITLNDVYLGPFKIQLYWNSLPDRPLYEVIALDPRPASPNESTTHPHVQNDVLCAGDAKVPISCALADARLFDFFQIVAQTLTTYNSSSPFVALEDWYGVPCSDCGSTTNEDYRSTCSGCECNVCDECCFSCCQCGEAMCSDCTERCQSCEDAHCQHCLDNCQHCSARVCSSCRSTENERCELCYEEETEEERQAETIISPGPAPLAAAQVAVHSNRVGEAAVPAGLR